jgi:hypothetical protein
MSNIRVNTSGKRFSGIDATLAAILQEAGLVTVLEIQPTQPAAPTGPKWSARIHPIAHSPHIYRVSGPMDSELQLFTCIPSDCPKDVADEFVLLVQQQDYQNNAREAQMRARR